MSQATVFCRGPRGLPGLQESLATQEFLRGTVNSLYPERQRQSIGINIGTDYIFRYTWGIGSAEPHKP